MGLVCRCGVGKYPCTVSYYLDGEAHGEPGTVPAPKGHTPPREKTLEVIHEKAFCPFTPNSRPLPPRSFCFCYSAAFSGGGRHFLSCIPNGDNPCFEAVSRGSITMTKNQVQFWQEAAWWLGALAGFIFLLLTVWPCVIVSDSMCPTLEANDVVFAYRTNEVHHEDVILFHHTKQGEEEVYAKRVIGLPGDTISVHDGKAWRNGEALDEPYLMEPDVRGVKEEVTVPEGMIFCMGDNRNHSIDSRDFGFVFLDSVIGKIFLEI